ncbi:MAG: hypothetical protein J3R72DRAFT_476835, partial [Linnemannia gamsii]
MTLSDKNALLPCNKVFSIPELFEEIAQYVEDSYRILFYVCRLWSSLFKAHVWKTVMIGEGHRKRLIGLKHHGAHIRDLRCYGVNNSAIRALSLNCPNLDKLYLFLNHHTSWTTYTQFQKIFLGGMQHRLSTVAIYFDATLLDTRLLWSMSRLTHLTHLELMVTWFDCGLISICMEMLTCCPVLKTFTLGFCYPPRDTTFARYKKRLRERVLSYFDEFPATIQEALGEGRDSQLASQDSMAFWKEQQLYPEQPPSNLDTTNNSVHGLHRLKLERVRVDLDRFIEILKRCPQLKELSADSLMLRQRGQVGQWSTIPQHCQQLETLRISGYSTCYSVDSIAQLITLFPRLDAFYLHIKNTSMEEWRTFDASIAKYRQPQQHLRDGHRHPLKTLTIKGEYEEPLSFLLELLSMKSLALETLVLHSGYFFSKFLSHEPNNFSSSLAPYLDRQDPPPELFSRPWQEAMKISLTRLDISTIVILDYVIAGTFFRRLEELSNLRALHVSVRHIQDWASEPFKYDRKVTVSSGNLPPVEYSYPSLQDLLVSKEALRCSRWKLTIAEAVFVMAVAPCLKYFHLAGGCIHNKDRMYLAMEFPEYFRCIPKERLDWIEYRFNLHREGVCCQTSILPFSPFFKDHRA